jgi:CpeS-like protein
MDITEFFQQSAGKWFSQRTGHHLGLKQSNSGKSDIQIEILDKEHLDVIKLCEQYEIDPALALCGARISWSGTMEQNREKLAGSTVLVPVATSDTPNEGQFLREMSDVAKTPVAGRYIMGSDNVLTLIMEYETIYSEERLWFASPNLRLRTSVLKRSGGFTMASFCSEIRMGGIK